MEKYQTLLAKLLTLQKIGVIQMPHAHGLRSAVSVLVAQQLEEHFYRAALAATEEARTSLAAFSEALARN
jgi:hypothetical protein